MKKTGKKSAARAGRKTTLKKSKKAKAKARPRTSTKSARKTKRKSRARTSRAKTKSPTIGSRLSQAYHTVVDTVTGTEALRNKLEPPGTSETE